MQVDSSRTRAPAAAFDQAAEWFVLLASGEASEADRSRWQAWRSADPANEHAWQCAHAASERFATIPRNGVRAALNALVRKSSIRHKVLMPLLLFALGISGWQGYRHSDFSADAITAIGEQREMQLVDGSRLLLDTNSAIDIDFSKTERVVHLRRGRVMVETGHHPADRNRPFMIETAEGRVIALGTRFTAEQREQSTHVVVLEARVAIVAADAEDAGAIVTAGHTASFDRRGAIEQADADAGDGAWSRGMLIASDMPLADLLAELARYRSEAIICHADVSALRISGAFPLRDTERVLAALAKTFDLRVERGLRGEEPILSVRAK